MSSSEGHNNYPTQMNLIANRTIAASAYDSLPLFFRQVRERHFCHRDPTMAGSVAYRMGAVLAPCELTIVAIQRP